MKAKLAGSTRRILGFSTLEIIIALALMSLVITSSLQTLYMSQYWILGSSLSSEALSVTKLQLEAARSMAAFNFHAATTSNVNKVKPQTSSSSYSCDTSFCYKNKLFVTDISVCAKHLQSDTSWRISARYSTTSVDLETIIVYPEEVIAQGSDCLTALPRGNWLSPIASITGIYVHPPIFSSGMDALGTYIYQTASSSPQLSIYMQPVSGSSTPILVGTSSGAGPRLNAIDVIRDMGTGRSYAYVMQHSSSSQLGVFDVTDVTAPVWLTERTLLGVDSTGSFPQGWRVVAYGQRLYVLTRETAGAELHIFDITKPDQPTERSAAIFNVNRTVNDMVVREQLLDGVTRRFIIMAGSADLKELGIFEVTSDVSVERVAINLSGTEDALSLSLSGNSIYIGRRATSGGPELYQYDFQDLLKGVVVPLATSEVGADVSTIRSSGYALYLGTNRSGAEFQVWSTSVGLWSSTTANTARISSVSVTRLAPLGVELSPDFVYVHSQSVTQPEFLSVVNAP